MDIVCVSHLRWNFVFQRPQHLLTRAARDGRVLYIEEPTEIDGDPRIDIDEDPSGVYVGVPRIPRSHELGADRVLLADLVSDAIARLALTDYVLWYYTPMALPFTH